METKIVKAFGKESVDNPLHAMDIKEENFSIMM